jgi:hypothetical protein
MTDHKAPKLEGDERQTLAALLQYQRESLVRKVTGLDEGDARRVLVDSGMTLLWLMKHMARAEVLWIEHRFAGLPFDLSDESVLPHDTLSGAVEHYRRTWVGVDAIVRGAATLDETCRNIGHEAPVNLRWVLMHLLEETARHAGHADILRELIDGTTGR